MWKLLTANGLAFTSPDGRELSIKSRKARAILAYVCVSAGSSVQREKLSGLLWSESSEMTARAALRQCLRRLGMDLAQQGCDIVKIERDKVTCNSPVKIDLQETIDAISKGIAPGNIADPKQILYGFDTLDPEFTAWLHVFREKWFDRQSKAIGAALVDSEFDEVTKTELAALLFELQPVHEPAGRVIIEAELRKGNLAGALKAYEQLWDALGEEWGEEPSKELQSLIVEAKQNGIRPMSPPAIRTTAPPVIFVETFQQSGPWSKPNYFIEGFRRELIASLVHFREWIIFDGGNTGPSESDYVISGGFFERNESAQLTVLLQEGRAGQCIISETMNLNFATWGDILQRIIHKTAISLNIHLSRRRATNPITDASGSFDAYDLWLQANEARAVWRKNTYETAETLLNQVVNQVPTYAPALSALAGLLNTRHLSEIGARRSAKRAGRALELARKSVALDPLDGRNHHALAWANAMDGVYNQAELHFELSIELNSTSPRTLVPCAQGLSFLGNHEEALRLTQTALDIHPTMIPRHWGYVQSIYYLVGDYTKSLEAAKIAGDSIIDLRAWNAAALAMNGEVDAARQKMRTFVDAAKDHWVGDETPTSEQVGDWLMHAFPIRDAQDAARLRDGCALAGLPV